MTSSISSSDGIVVVGIGCRFPGAADPDSFWRLLDTGDDPIREMPSDRWPVDAWKQAVPGFVSRGGFLEDIAGFDPQPFGLSPREAAEMDPQQRLLLEVCFEALEHAGVAPRELRGRSVGVYAAIGASEYDLRFQAGPGAEPAAYSGTGNDTSFASGRISTILGLRGPAVSINTACSSALVALAHAVRDLRQGTTEAALVAAVNLAVIPDNTARLVRMGVLAPDGRCKAFDTAADGYGRGEGAGAVLLLREDEAIRLGVPLRARIRGIATNQDAGDRGLVAPSQRAQEDVLRAALADGDLVPADVDAIEAHGTGTPVGDPVEVAALGQVFAGCPLLLGSGKARVGHLEVAAGMVGLVKAVSCLERGSFPAHPVQSPIALPPGFVLPARTTPLRGPGIRRIGVSAFGMSGTNSHVILEEVVSPAAPAASRDAHVLPLSAVSREALVELARIVAARMFEVTDIAGICHTAGVGRAHREERLAIVASTPAELGRRLLAWADGHPLDHTWSGTVGTEPGPDGVDLAATAERWVLGADVDWATISGPARRESLPLTPYRRTRLWVDAVAAPSTSLPAETPASWFWGVDWRPVPAMTAVPGGTWIVLTDATGTGAALSHAVPGALRVEQGPHSGAIAADRYVVDVRDPNALGTMFRHFAPKDVRGVLYLWGLDQHRGDPDDVVDGTATAAALVQAVLAELPRRRPDFRLWLVSRGAVALDPNDPVDASHGALWGLGRCVAMEHPELGVGNVDVDGDLAPLVALMNSPTDEDQLVLRGRVAHAARVVRRTPGMSELPAVGDGWVIVTGGTGALGLRFATSLVDRGARRLVLLSRTGRSSDAVEALRARGAEIRVAQVDVTDGRALDALVAGLGSIAGVVHAAGVLDDGVLLRLDPSRFRTVMAPKVHGTCRLVEAVRGQPLRFLVFCSSVSSMFGSLGQANYAAANAWMDTFALQLRHQGIPAVSIAWGPWGEGGMAAGHLERIASHGLRPLDPRTAGAALGPALGLGANVGVVDIDRDQLQSLGARVTGRPLLREMFGGTPAPVTDLEGWLVTRIAAALRIAPASLQRERPLTWHGFDSIQAIELKRAIDEAFGTQVPLAVLQSGPSLRGLVRALEPLMPAPKAGGPTFAALPSVSPVPIDVDAAPMPASARFGLMVLLVVTGSVALWMFA